MLAWVKDFLLAPFTALQIKWFALRLRSNSLDTRFRSVNALGQMRDPRGLPLLVPLLRAPDASIRWIAASALGNIDDPQAIAPLLAAHSIETDPYARLWMAVSLAHLGDVRTLESLFADVATVDAEGKEDWDWAETISYSIGRRLGKRALANLAKAITHPNPTVRWISLMALGEIQDIQAIELLKLAQSDGDELIRDEATQMLNKWSAK